MLVKLKGTVVLPQGSPGGSIKIRYPRSHQDNARTAGGMFDGLVTAAGALTAADGTDLVVLGSALGENDPPILVLTITPTGHTPYTLSIKPVPNLPVPGAADVVDITKPSNPTPVLTSPTIDQLLLDTGTAKAAALAAAAAANAGAGTVAAAVAAIPGQVATGLAPVAPALAQVTQALADNAQIAALGLAVAGVTPATTSNTTADPPSPPAGVSAGVKFDAYGNRVLLAWTGSIWQQTKRMIGSDGLAYRDARYYGVAAGRTPSQVSQGLLDVQQDAGATGSVGIVQLPALTLDLDQTMIPGTYGNVELRGVKGQTILRAALTSTDPLLQGSSITLRDVILDGLGRVSTGFQTAGAFRMEGGAVKNITGTTLFQGIALWQRTGSTEFYVRDVLIDGVTGYENGVIGDSVGAHRAILLSGQYADIDRVVIQNLPGVEDTDAIHVYMPADPDKLWADSFARFGRVRVISPGKRAMKIVGSNVIVEELIVTSTDETDAGCLHAGVELFGSDNQINRLVVVTPRALYGAVDSGQRNKISNAVIQNGVGKSYLTARGSQLKGYSDLGTDNSFSGTISTSNQGVFYGGTSRNNTTRCSRITARNPVLMDFGGAANHDIQVGIAQGLSTDLTFMDAAVRLGTGSVDNRVRIGEARYGAFGIAVTGTSDRNALSIDKYTQITTPINTSGLTASGNIFGGATALTAQLSSVGQPALTLPPFAQLNPYVDRTFSDVLENITLRTAGVTVTYANAGTGTISQYTAAGLTGQNVLNGDLGLPFSGATPFAYPMTLTVDYGTGTLFQSSPQTQYRPALLFRSVPGGLTGFKFESYNGSAWTTLFDLTGLTPGAFVLGPAVTIPSGTKQIRYTLNGTTPASGSLTWRRAVLYYPELDPTQYKHPGWIEFRASHNANGSHPSVTQALDFPSIAAGATSAPLTLYFGGVLASDSVILTPPSNWPTGAFRVEAVVASTSNISVYVTNTTGAAIDPPSGVWTARYLR
jgi:hypothetical protein